MVAGLESDDNGTITFSDGTHNVVVNIVNGAPVSPSVNLSGLSDGPITATLSASDPAGSTFNVTATARLDQDLDEHPTVAFALANIGKANAGTVQFTVNGLEPDDNGTITFSDGTHNVVVNIVKGAPVSTSVNLSGLSDGPITATLSASDPAGNTFSAHASTQLDQDLNEIIRRSRLRMPTSVGPKRRASSLPSLGLNLTTMARSRSATAPTMWW